MVAVSLKNGVGAVLCGIVAAFAIYYLAIIAENAQAIAENTREIAENMPHYTECGACGAETLEAWYVQNMYTNEFVPVCQVCYEEAE